MKEKKREIMAAVVTLVILAAILTPDYRVTLRHKPAATVTTVEDQEPEIKKLKRHPFMIHTIAMTGNKRFPYEYTADFLPHPIMTSKVFAIGDTLQFTTLSIWRQRTKFQEKIKNLKAKLAKRDSVLKTIKLIIEEE